MPKILEIAKQSASFKEVGLKLGISKEQARQRVKKSLRQQGHTSIGLTFKEVRKCFS